jgi:hypothetical protein
MAWSYLKAEWTLAALWGQWVLSASVVGTEGRDSSLFSGHSLIFLSEGPKEGERGGVQKKQSEEERSPQSAGCATPPAAKTFQMEQGVRTTRLLKTSHRRKWS